MRAFFEEKGHVETQGIDIFVCSSTVGNLLRFARQDDKPFRILVEVVGNTAFFTRRENSPTELMVDVRGYGHSFPEAYTTWDASVKGSSSHQRLLQYDFAGLNCVLRFTCDGYLRAKVPDTSAAHRADNRSVAGEGSLASILDGLRVAPSTLEPTRHSETLKVEMAGLKIAQEDIFDLKTRSVKKKNLDVLGDQLPRLWLAQIPNFILAHHSSGRFDNDDISVQDVWKHVENYQRDSQKTLKRLGWLLREILEQASAREDMKLELCCKGKHVLELRAQDADAADILSPELKLLWLQGGLLHDYEDEDSEHGYGDEQSDHKYRNKSDGGFESDESEKDYTACSAEECGYCGHCSY